MNICKQQLEMKISIKKFLEEQGFDKWKIGIVLGSLDNSYMYGRIDSLDNRLESFNKGDRKHSQETKSKISESMKKSWKERKHE